MLSLQDADPSVEIELHHPVAINQHVIPIIRSAEIYDPN